MENHLQLMMLRLYLLPGCAIDSSILTGSGKLCPTSIGRQNLD